MEQISPDEIPRSFNASEAGDLATDADDVGGDIGQAVQSFKELHGTRRSDLSGVKKVAEAARNRISEDFEGFAESIARGLFDGLVGEYRRAIDRLRNDPEGKVPAGLEFVDDDPEASSHGILEDVSFEGWRKSFPSAPLRDFVSAVADPGEDLIEYADHVASLAVFLASRDLNRRLRERGTVPKSLPDQKWDEHLEGLASRDAYIEGLIRQVASISAQSTLFGLKEKNGGQLSPERIEQLLGVSGEPLAEPPELRAFSNPEQDGFFPFATGLPSSEGATAIRQARTGWEDRDHRGSPIYKIDQDAPFDVKGRFAVLVGDNEQAFRAAGAEMTQRVLNDFGRRTAWLHLVCAAYATQGDPGKYSPIPRKRVYDYLGITRESRKDMRRDQRDKIVEEEFEKLKRLGVQLTVLDGPQEAPEELGLQNIWDLNYHAWGSKRIEDPTRFLARKEWRLLVRPNAWAQLYLNGEKGVRQFGYFTRELIKSIDWHNNPAAGDLAIELLKYARFNDGKPRDLKVERMLEICQLTSPKGKVEKNRYRERLERAILQQQRWGWELDWTRWPEEHIPEKENRPDFPKGYWRGHTKDEWEAPFHEWKVTFKPREDLAELNRTSGQSPSSESKETLPSGWAARIKAILDQTDNTQQDLAGDLEVDPSTITRWKNGSRTPTKEGHKAKLRDIERRAGLRSV
jgi:hypothetical protein